MTIHIRFEIDQLGSTTISPYLVMKSLRFSGAAPLDGGAGDRLISSSIERERGERGTLSPRG
jgi:hypothetical protein